MARTSITTARYNPFTMEELYSPVLRATEQHLQQQEKYDELANQASVWKYRIGNDSPTALKDYNDFMDRLNAATDDLYNNGINNPSARDNARALIRENPLPALQEAYNRQQKDEQINRGLGPDVRFLKRNTLDDYLKGTEDNTYVNLANIEKNAATDITNVAKGIVSNPTFNRAEGSGGQFWDVTTTQGITNKMWDLADTRKQNPNWTTGDSDLDAQLDKLNTTRDNIYNASGYYSFVEAGNESGAKDIDYAIKSGLLAGSAVTSHDLKNNGEYVPKAQRESLSIQREASNRAKEEWEIEKQQKGWYKDPTDGQWKQDVGNIVKNEEELVAARTEVADRHPEWTDEQRQMYIGTGNPYGTTRKSSTSEGGSGSQPQIKIESGTYHVKPDGSVERMTYQTGQNAVNPTKALNQVKITDEWQNALLEISKSQYEEMDVRSLESQGYEFETTGDHYTVKVPSKAIRNNIETAYQNGTRSAMQEQDMVITGIHPDGTLDIEYKKASYQKPHDNGNPQGTAGVQQ